MAQKKSYSRYFIILQEDEKGYALASDKLPSGYAKLETKNDKCKVSYYVQNLKKEHTPYYMLLICNKKDVNKIIKIGEMNIDDHGRAEVSYEYPVENIANSTIHADKVVGAAIVKISSSTILSVMSGFASTEIPDWKGFDIIQLEKREEKVEITPELNQVRVEKNPFEEYEEEIEIERHKKDKHKEKEEDCECEEMKKIKEEKKHENHKEFQVKEEHKEKHHDKDEDCKEDHKEHHHDKDEDCKEEHKEYHHKEDEDCKEDHHEKEHECKEEKYKEKSYKEEKNYPKGSVGTFFKELVDEFEEIEDLCSEIKRCRWFKIPVKNLECMHDASHYNKYTVVYYPMINYYPYIKKYDHYLLGYKCDIAGKMKYLVYAVPGKKSSLEQPYGGKSGFVTWIPLKEEEDNDESFGYWLMFYDFRTSTIVIPVK